MVIEMNVDIKGLENMIQENENAMKKTATTSYPNKKMRILQLNKIPQLPHCYLLIQRGSHNKIRIDAINSYPGGGACWYLKVSIRDKSYYGYFDTLLEEVQL